MVATSIGTSTLYSTTWMVERLRDINPGSILDVGCGWGRWGFLAREFLELWAHRYAPADWAIQIDAVDIHEGTWTPIHHHIYNRTTTADIRTWTPEQGYDVAIAADVLEHMPKAEGAQVLGRLLGWCENVLVGIPLGNWPPRPGFDGNPHEAHLAQWFEEDFEAYDVRHHHITRTEDKLPYGLFWLA